MKKFIFSLLFLQLFQLHATQYMYPVADFNNGNTLIVLYQKSLENIELWIVDTKTGCATKGLSSFLTPANVLILPCDKGFSFIDQGYIKIKEFEKRSARTIEIYEPIGLFSNMHWSNEELFYFTARTGDFFQIFQSDVESNIEQITDEKADALYPQIIDSTLFYLRKDTQKNVDLVAKNWNGSLRNSDQVSKVMISQLEKQACYLRMISTTEGFYMQAPLKKSVTNIDCYDFVCHHVQKINNQWIDKKLFTFQIPLKYLTGKDRLYESIEPFLPNFCSNHDIYFVSWQSQNNEFQLKKYNVCNQDIKIINPTTNNNFNEKIFAPYVCNDTIYCGIIFDQDQAVDFEKIKIPRMYDTKPIAQ